jgi:uncharacterized integral membrane protein
MHFFTVLVLVIAIAFVFITVQNPEPIEMTLATWHFSGPLAVILASFFGVGILAGIFLMIPTWWKRVKQSRTRNKRIHELEEEISGASQQVEQEGTVEAEKAPEKEKESEKIEEEKKSEF